MSQQPLGRYPLGLVVLSLLVFAVTWIAAFIPFLIFFVGGVDSHVFLSRTQRFVMSAVPTVIAAIVMALAILALDRRVFGADAENRRGTATQRWAIRIAPALIVAVAFGGYREQRLRAEVALARTTNGRSPAMALAGSTRGRKALAEIVADRELRPDVRIQTAIILQEGHGEPVPELDALIEELRSSSDPAVRATAAQGISGLYRDRARDTLEGFLSDSDPAVLLAALRSVEQVSFDADAPLLDRLEVLMMSDQPGLRLLARDRYFQHIRLRDSEENRKRLLALLASADRNLRIRAVSKLLSAGDLGGFDVALTEIRYPLPENMDGRDDGSFQILTALLGGTKDERAAPALWTLAYCPSLSDSQREQAHRNLQWLFTKPAPGGQRPFVPEAYTDSDLSAAPSRPAWRADYCR